MDTRVKRKKDRILWVRNVILITSLVITMMANSGCGKSISDEGKQIVENLLNEASVWESDTIWTMSFVKDGDEIQLFVYWLEHSPTIGFSTMGQKRWYSTESPIKCVFKSDREPTSFYGEHFSFGWSKSWSTEQKRQKLTDLYLDFQYGD